MDLHAFAVFARALLSLVCVGIAYLHAERGNEDWGWGILFAFLFAPPLP